MCVGENHAEDTALAKHLVRHKQLLIVNNNAKLVGACETKVWVKRQVANQELN